MDIDAIKAKAVAAAPALPEWRPQVAGRIVHIDGDYLAYYAAGSDSTTTEIARNNVSSRVRKCKLFSGAEVAIIHLTHENSNKAGRYDVATIKPYQGQRSGAKPALWDYLRNYIENYAGRDFAVKVWSDREADDGVAYNLRSATFAGRMDAVHTRDKDFRMFEGIHIKWEDFSLTEVHKDDFLVIGKDGKVFGHAWFWQQMIQGDGADNIPGVESKGPKAAEIILACANNAEAEAHVIALYEDQYGAEWPERVAEQAMLLWMRNDQRADPYGFCEVLKNREVKHAAAELLTRNM